MSKIFYLLLLLYCSIKSSIEYDEEIFEFIPKTIISSRSDKIFKYNLSCKDERKETSIYFQAISNNIFTLSIYYDATNIEKNENGYYINYNITETITLNEQFTFKNLTCNHDYYFVIYKRIYDMDKLYYIQFSIINEETNLFNLSPSYSLFYTLFPRKKDQEEHFYYSFNETKYALINYHGFIKIEENDKIIYNNNNSKLFEFKKDLKYNIYYKSDSPFCIHFYNEKDHFKYNKEDFPIMLFGEKNELYFEIDISEYEVGNYILIQASDYTTWTIKYQFKNDYNQKNMINLGEYYYYNYIPIKKTKNDSSLILYIKYDSFSVLSVLNIVKDDIMEIDSDLNLKVMGPKILFFDYYKFNKFQSFAIESSNNFIFCEQEIESRADIVNMEYNNIYISKQNDKNSLIFKRGFIYLNSTSDYQIMIKKFNFSIIQKDISEQGHEYLSLCQGEEPKEELYYYKSRNILIELFTPVFGSFDSFIIKESDIKTLSDLDFDMANETNSFIPDYQKSYLKIVCKEPTLIKHSYIKTQNTYSSLTSGKSYIFSTKNIPDKIYLSDELKGKNISLKFSILGTKNNYQIQLNLNGTIYTLDNKSMEFELEYQEAGSYFINIIKGEDIKEQILIEIFVGVKEDLNEFEIKNLSDSLGNLSLDKGKGIIIKIPKEYDDNYYNFSIIQNELNNKFKYYIEIFYDKIEFTPLNIKYDTIYEYSQIISFFLNPYSYISNSTEKPNEKFFYIFLFNNGDSNSQILIKKPKLFTDININKINTFPKLEGENEKFYYKIPLPNEDYDSLLIQTNNI